MTAATPGPLPPDTLYTRLRDACGADWQAYTCHRFVRELGAGALELESFRYYLIQDYVFLIHFARAWALAVYKSDTLEDMCQASATLNALLHQEMALHLRFCAGWGISQAQMETAPEAAANLAYTRYVLERGLSGDLLDLLVALAPCVAGYAEIGKTLASQATPSNPYREWIASYAGEDYQCLSSAMLAQLERTAARLLTPAREASCLRTFRSATRLEVGFWDMALSRSP
jgi:thiaminase/transcriptional activator TenA